MGDIADVKQEIINALSNDDLDKEMHHKSTQKDDLSKTVKNFISSYIKNDGTKKIYSKMKTRVQIENIKKLEEENKKMEKLNDLLTKQLCEIEAIFQIEDRKIHFTKSSTPRKQCGMELVCSTSCKVEEEDGYETQQIAEETIPQIAYVNPIKRKQNNCNTQEGYVNKNISKKRNFSYLEESEITNNFTEAIDPKTSKLQHPELPMSNHLHHYPTPPVSPYFYQQYPPQNFHYNFPTTPPLWYHQPVPMNYHTMEHYRERFPINCGSDQRLLMQNRFNTPF